jgi:TrmH family RNA methyltransferase
VRVDSNDKTGWHTLRLSATELKQLAQKKFRQQSPWFLAEGEHLVSELARAAQVNAELQRSLLLVDENYHGELPAGFEVQGIKASVMARISDTKTPQGIMACVPKSALPKPAVQLGSQQTGGAILPAVYLYQVQDPGNLGTILRTLAWFGGYQCLLSPDSVDPFNGKCVRASMGAIYHVPIESQVEASVLPERFSSIACLDMQGDTMGSDEFHRADCLVFGNEARGLPGWLADDDRFQRFTIPGSGKIESLNLASVLNMAIYERSR